MPKKKAKKTKAKKGVKDPKAPQIPKEMKEKLDKIKEKIPNSQTSAKIRGPIYRNRNPRNRCESNRPNLPNHKRWKSRSIRRSRSR